jgi:N-acetylmuramoyl-L-alanine amidase
MPSTEGRGSSPRTRTFAFMLGLLLTTTVLHAQSSVPIPVPPPPARPDLPPLPTPPQTAAAQPAFSVVIDPAHGGSDTGARIAPNTPEKDLVLALAGRLHAALASKGVAVTLTRESDTDLPASRRAGIANHTLASACLLLHATASGAGVHLYTSSLAPSSTPPAGAVPALLPWQTAQSGWIARSLRLSSELNTALGQAGVPTTLGIASVQPLDNLNCPAVAVEISPLAATAKNKPVPVSDQTYQQRVVDALVAAILEWRTDWKQQP